MPVRRADAREDAVGWEVAAGGVRGPTQKPACVVAGGDVGRTSGAQGAVTGRRKTQWPRGIVSPALADHAGRMSHRVLGAPCVSQGMPRDGRAPAMFRYGTPGPG